MKRVVLSLVVVTAIAVLACTASAQTFSGQTAVGSCISAGGDWARNPGTLSWIVSRNPENNVWTYQYTLNVGSQGNIDHFILELSPGVTQNDLFDYNWPAANRQVGNFGPSADNPGFPPGCGFYGIEFSNADNLVEIFAFRTLNAPTWGDFYAANGISEGLGPDFMYNSSICDSDPLDPPANGANFCKILRPEGGVAPVIPEPGSMALAMMGVLPILGYKLRRH